MDNNAVDLGSRFLRWERRDAVAWVTIPKFTGRPPHRTAQTFIYVQGVVAPFGVMESIDKIEELMEG